MTNTILYLLAIGAVVALVQFGADISVLAGGLNGA